MKTLTESIRTQIKLHIKNGLDIAPLIEGFSIKNEDLTGAIITTFNRADEDMSGVNLTKCIIGLPSKINNISGAKLMRSKWCDAIVQGTFFARRIDARNADFSGAVLTNMEFQHANFNGARFCEACIRIGSDYSWGAQFDNNFFADLTQGWSICVMTKEKWEHIQKILQDNDLV
jgi:uncharacterized protein YjbI with pentapeptide repeats